MFALLRAAARAQSNMETRARITELGGRLLSAVSERPADRQLPGKGELTPREVDVLTLAALGTKNREIAELLGVSGETVKSYLRNAMLKLGAHSRRAAVDRARLAGVIP
jgi:DNA-binding NarL/FixJ family response regulator